MTKKNEAELYNLSLEAGSPCFQFFSPEIYTEVRGYQNNPAFENQEARSLLSLANKALIFFTRANSAYETDLKEQYAYISEREKKKADENKRSTPAFTTIPFQAFKKPRSDFEEAVAFCLRNLCSMLDIDELSSPEYKRTGYNDSELLDFYFRNKFLKGDVKLKTSSRRTYYHHHLLAAFSLWKLDRALIAIAQNKASEVANLIYDIHTSLNIAQREHSSHVKMLDNKKKKSEAQAAKGKKRHKDLESLKAEAIKIYKKGDNGKQWKSVKRAAEVIYKELSPNSKLSSEEGVKTISGWLMKADPKGKLSKYKRKKVTG
ncbi:MAG: hypothetical protein IPJ01_07310 [Micavibrio sp.]|nr:hypothetical protein [Micavibrio sp.]MBK9562500.1 hypothetical protein [Micavibrio sp.]